MRDLALCIISLVLLNIGIFGVVVGGGIIGVCGSVNVSRSFRFLCLDCDARCIMSSAVMAVVLLDTPGIIVDSNALPPLPVDVLNDLCFKPKL